jgi:SAM-dependent methyltransferase
MFENLMDQWCIPYDHCRQVSISSVTRKLLLDETDNIKVVLDLGCGEGNSVDFFRSISPDIQWIGLDVDISPEVEKRTRADAEFKTFDGINIPFEDNYFDLIYCNQVLEHVRFPGKLLAEVCRVLKPKGYLVGATSQLEPYHSLSVWNYTPHGFRLLAEEAGMKLKEIRPGIDAFTLIARAALQRPKFFSRWWEKESPFNKIINAVGFLARKENREINFAKLVLCGQFCFIVQKKEK